MENEQLTGLEIESGTFTPTPAKPNRTLDFAAFSEEYDQAHPVWNEAAKAFQVKGRPDLTNVSFADIWMQIAREQDVDLSDLDKIKLDPHAVLKTPPENVQAKFLYHQGQYFFKDRKNAPAFKDRGASLKTDAGDPVVIASMLDVAQAKGWASIRLKGEADYKREAWYQAKLRGLNVEGFDPQPADEARLKAEMERRDKIDAKTAEKQQNEKKEPLNRLAGIVVEHGAAPYQFDDREGAERSYFVSLLNADGKVNTHWGVDLERASLDAGLKIGDEAALKRLGKKTVIVNSPVYDENNRITSWEKKESHLTAWEIAARRLTAPEQESSAPGTPESATKTDAAKTAQQDPAEASTKPANPNVPVHPIVEPDARLQAITADDTAGLLQYPELSAFYAVRRGFEAKAMDLFVEPEKRQAFLREINQGLGKHFQAGLVPVEPKTGAPELSLNGKLQTLAIGELARSRGLDTAQVKSVVKKAQDVARKLEAAGVILKAPKIYDSKLRMKKSLIIDDKGVVRVLEQQISSPRR